MGDAGAPGHQHRSRVCHERRGHGEGCSAVECVRLASDVQRLGLMRQYRRALALLLVARLRKGGS